MHKYTKAFRPAISTLFRAFQNVYNYTDSQMAELLGISLRAYCYIKTGISGVSVATLCTFLMHLPEEHQAPVLQYLLQALREIEKNYSSES